VAVSPLDAIYDLTGLALSGFRAFGSDLGEWQVLLQGAEQTGELQVLLLKVPEKRCEMRRLVGRMSVCVSSGGWRANTDVQ
jgi:hypothetical protein